MAELDNTLKARVLQQVKSGCSVNVTSSPPPLPPYLSIYIIFRSSLPYLFMHRFNINYKCIVPVVSVIGEPLALRGGLHSLAHSSVPVSMPGTGSRGAER